MKLAARPSWTRAIGHKSRRQVTQKGKVHRPTLIRTDRGLAMREAMDDDQHPAQEGWELEQEWLQEQECEQDEVGPWADFV